MGNAASASLAEEDMPEEESEYAVQGGGGATFDDDDVIEEEGYASLNARAVRNQSRLLSPCMQG